MTMVELVVVLAMMAVLTTLAVVGARPVAERYRLRDATELAMQLIAEGQARARSTGRCHRVVVYSAGALAAAGAPGDMLALEARPDADCQAPPAGVAWLAVQREALATGVVGQNLDDSTHTWVELRPQGRVRDNGGVSMAGLRFEAGGQARLVRVAPQGVPCLTDPVTPAACP